MKLFKNKIASIIGTIVLALGFLFVFFGGTWGGVRLALELFGIIYILQLAYSVITRKD